MPLFPGPSWRAPPGGPGSPQTAAVRAGPPAAELVAAQCGCDLDERPAPAAPCEDSQRGVHSPPGAPAGPECPAEPSHSPPAEEYEGNTERQREKSLKYDSNQIAHH